MKIAVLKETNANEARVAATPDTVKKLVAAGASVTVQAGAGEAIGFVDDAYISSGAEIADTTDYALAGADVVLCVNLPSKETLKQLPENSSLIGTLNPHAMKTELKSLAKQKVNAFALELLPRVTRAQSMDVLSSQSNLAGYRAVVEAFAVSGKVVPMMMTAAGTVPPAKVLILGAGVAGLQAIATAKRMGAVVSAFDVRAVVKEQVESLGAKFIEVKQDATESGETSGGYAKEMSEDYKRRQSELIADTIRTQDVVITTALIPGKPAPVLITPEMVSSMKPGSIIVDLAVASGGNCPLSKPDKIVNHQGVQIVGYTNMPARCAVDASALYARNLLTFVNTLLIKAGSLDIQWEDELVKGTLLTRDGQITHPQFSAASE